jgi:hypothetical protein
MNFDPSRYGERVREILALDGAGQRLMPLVAGQCSSREAQKALSGRSATDLFPASVARLGALAGLWLYFSCFDEAHGVAQDDPSAEGSFWHAILHRQEPDASNSAYWFHRVGTHPVFPALAGEAGEIISRYPDAGFEVTDNWNPFEFIHFCERAARRPGSDAEHAALEIQRAEWQLLFDYCARPRT